MEKLSTYEAVQQLVDSQEHDRCLLLREDFVNCGPSNEVEDALQQLVAENRLAQLREDAFAYPQVSQLDKQKLILQYSLQELAVEYAKRKGAVVKASSAQREYTEGSTQVPNGRWVGVDRPIEGEMRFRKRTVRFEHV